MAKTYDSYKDSGIAWIGEIPSEWGVCRIKDIYQERSETTETGTERLLSVSEYYGVAPTADKIEDGDYLTRAESLIGYKKCYKDDFVSNIMLAWKGSFGTTKYDGIVSPAYCVYKPVSTISPEYYHYLFRTDLYKSRFKSYSKGIIDSRLRLYTPFFYLVDAILPPLSEQQSIASFLDTKCGEIDSLISLQEEMISELQAYKQSVITEAVTKGLDPNAKMNCCASREKNDACISSSETQPAIERKFKDSGVEWIGEIPEKWSKDKVFRVFANIGSGTTPKATEDSNFEGEINWIQSGDINGSIMNSCKNKISQQVLNKYSALKIYKAPFIIVAMYGASVGNISVSMIDGCVNQACCVMSDSVHYFDYLFYAIKSAKDYLIYRAEGGGQPNISQDKLKNLWLPIPPLSEQQSIANYLDDKTSQIDSLISLKQQKIDELKSYKKSIIYEYVTGKKRV